MQGLAVLFYFAIAVAAVYTIADWRRGIYIALFVEMIRDPVRKLDSAESIGITLMGSALWGAVILGAWLQNQRVYRIALAVYPGLRRMSWFVVAALFPGALLSVIFYSNGYLIALVGALSYLAPLLGMFVGLFYLQDERQLRRLLGFFVLLNSVALIGSIAEWRGLTSPVLGSLKNMVWIRHREGYTVQLINGVYRSPDIMGLHAAFVMMFSIFLAMQGKGQRRGAWWVLAIWGGLSLLLCGRRKMIGIPVVFVLSWLLLDWRLSPTRRLRVGIPLLVLTLASIVGIIVITNTLDISETYTDYALSTITEGTDRVRDGSFAATWETIRQNGLLGAGLGTGTQGRYYLGEISARVWQEDGLSRLFLELGVLGVAFLIFALVAFGDVFRRSFKLDKTKQNAHFGTQTGLWAMFAANGSSFLIAHQHFSGDPAMAIFAVMMAGMAIGLPMWQYLERHSAESRGGRVEMTQAGTRSF